MEYSSHKEGEEHCTTEWGKASLWHTGHFPQFDLQNKNFWLKRYMPTLKNTKKTMQYLRELKWENHKIKLVFNLGIISDTTLPGASAFKSKLPQLIIKKV